MARILHKRSATTGVVPSATELDVGELAINTADGKLFTKRASGVVTQLNSSSLSTSSDVVLTSLANNDLLQYSTATSKCVNIPQTNLVDGGNF